MCMFCRSLFVFRGVRVTRSLVLCVMFCRSLFVVFILFLLDIVLSVLRFTDSNYPFDIFKLFLSYQITMFNLPADTYLNV
jgi:hypothetical protein